jgi:hypothetical protein
MAFDTTNLRDYQVPHAVRLAQALHEPGFPCSWDTSDTGTGKTYAACALVRHYDIPTAVVCPKSLMPTWQRVADYMGVPKGRLVPLNYDIIRTGRTHFGDWSMLPRGTSRMKYFKWNEQINLLIFDEFQRCRGAESLTSRIALGAKLSGVPTIGVSATPGESPMDFRALGYLSGWFEWNMFHNWVQGKNCIKPFGQPKWKFVDKAGRSAVDVMAELHHAMMKRGSRISIEELGDKFPKNVLDTKLYRISEANKIQKLYKQVAETLSQLEERMGSDRDPEHGLTQTLRERQKIELLKVGLMVELAKSEIAQGRSVVIFCNFLFTIQALSQKLRDYDPAIITGASGWGYDILRRPDEDTDAANQRFQHNRTFLAIAQSDVGGVGLGFHDLYDRPRTSLINPHWSSMVLNQILGRIRRDGALSPALQKFLLVEGTVEETVFEAFLRKEAQLQTLLTNLTLKPFAGFKPNLVTV